MKKNRTFNQNKNQFLRIKNWVDNNRDRIPKTELKAFDLFRNDLLEHKLGIPLNEFLEVHMDKIRTWDLYRMYKGERIFEKAKEFQYMQQLTKINVKILLIQNKCDFKTTLYLYRLLKREKRRIKKLIEQLYTD